MPADRIFAWGGNAPPDLDDVYDELIEYFHVEACWEFLMVSRSQSRIYVTLPGDNRRSEVVPRERRYIEVFVDELHIDVMTRMQDPYTEGVADGFYKFIASRWPGVPG